MLIESLKSEAEVFFNTPIKIKQMDHQGQVFEAKKKDVYEVFQKKSGKYRTLSVKKQNISFTCDELSDINENIFDFNEKYDQVQKKYLNQVLEKASSYFTCLETLSTIVSEHDILMGLGQLYSVYKNDSLTPMCLPVFVENEPKKLVIDNSWHPLIQNCVKNNCHFDNKIKRVYLVTGPNMGGKSTFIRQIAICTLLAHVGCPVPASSIELSVFSGIYTRVGASDMQIKGISTFFAEMIETANMLKSSDENSLLIVDELGRGTSTFEGISIARSTLQYILQHKKSFCMFATHFHQITSMQKEFKGIYNVCLTSSNSDKLCFDYKVNEGFSDGSFGINILRQLRFPHKIIEDASLIEKKIENKNIC